MPKMKLIENTQNNQYTETITTPREPMMKIMPNPNHYTLKAVTGVNGS
jgi:hypothetical protein